ncbi:MAG: hypothetical protein WCH21_03625 [Bacteroidota bacterium]
MGFVIQKFDTESGKCISQEFVAGDEVSYETESGKHLDDDLYQPYDMVNP